MKLIILDRDGVINEDSDDFIKTPDEWIPIPGSLEAIAQLNHADYRVLVATNQSGIARGHFSIDTLNRIHEKMHRALQNLGGSVEAIFYCPHGPDDQCECRKPKAGLFDQIKKRLNTSLADVPCVGDSLRDIQSAQVAGGNPILVRTGKGERTIAANEGIENIPVFNNLADAVQHLLKQDS